MPRTIRASEPKAQRTWQKTHDSAVETYGEGERAHRVAYAALKHSFKKERGIWVRKARKGPSDPQAAQRYGARPKLTAGGKVAKTESEAQRKAQEARREYRAFRKRRG